MEVRSKFRVLTLFLLAAPPCLLFAQKSGPDAPRNPPVALDANQIVRLSVAATERSWLARDHLIYLERDEDRRLDSSGKLKSANVEITRMLLVNGARFEELMEHNGQLPTAEERKKIDQDLARLKRETAEERSNRLRKSLDNTSFLRAVLEGFDFSLVGEELVGGRPAWVLEAKPHPGYRAHGKYDKMFAKVVGRLWVDQRDFGCVKIEGQVTQPISIGLFVASVQRGSRVILKQAHVGEGVWVPERFEMRASARILFLKNLSVERILTYSDYRPAGDDQYAVSK